MRLLNIFKKRDIPAKQDGSSKKNKNTKNKQPEFIIVMGGVCSGKTTLRKNRYADRYVNIDAGEIFIDLSQGEYYDFPSHLEEKMNQIGLMKMRESISTKKSIVIEIIGAKSEIVEEIIELSKKINYTSKVVYVECEIEEALQRNINRGNDNISAHYCEPYHIMWFKQAAVEFLNPEYAKKTESSHVDNDDHIYDEDIEDYAFGRGNLSQRKIDLIEKMLREDED